MGLEVNTLTISRGSKPVIWSLSFALAEGEARLLRGPNGVGKSTLLRGLAGLLEIQGRDFDPSEEVSYAGHLDALKSSLTVRENLEIWAGLGGAGQISRAVDAFALSDLLDQPVHVCSAGQKRRAGLARLVLEKRKLWLMDEPTTALDTEAVKLVEVAILDHLSKGGMAIVATHIPLDINAQTLTLSPPAAPKTGEHADPFLDAGLT